MTVEAEIIEPDRGRPKIVVEFPFDFGLVNKVKTIGGAKFVPKDKGGPYWTVPLNIDVCHTLREVFGKELKIGDELRKWAKAETETTSELVTLATADDAVLERLPLILPKLADFVGGRPYQRADIKFKANNPAPADTNQPGLGKTVTTIGAVFEAPGDLHAGPQLVSAPVSSLEVVWLEELSRHDQPYPVLVAYGDRSDRQDVLNRAIDLYDDGEPFWLVVNPAMVAYERKFNYCSVHARSARKPTVKVAKECPECEEYLAQKFPELFEIKWKHKIIDEFHKCGLTNTTTLTSQAMSAIEAEKAIGISGTPMGGKPIKLYGLLHFLRPEEFTSKWAFADQWLSVTDNGYGKDIGGIRKDRQEAFFRMLGRYVLRRTKAEVLKELPPKQYVHVPVTMTPTQAKQYRQFEKEAAIKIGSEELSATSILAEYTRLKQFANAAQDVKKIWDPQTEKEKLGLTALPDSGKLIQTERILNELGIDPKEMEGDEQCVIFSQFSDHVNMITQWLQDNGYPAEKLTGDTKTAERTRLVREFQSEQGLRILVMTTTAGGVAITLDRASTVIFWDETWNPDDQEQAEDRVHRGSRFHQVTIHYLRSKDSIEQLIQDQAQDKRDINALILDIRRGIGVPD